MTHVRTQIRDRFKTTLEAALPGAAYTVFASRRYARNHTPDLAVVDMRFQNDQQQAREVFGSERVRIASLYIRVMRSADDETQLDAALDADEVLIVEAIEAATWSDLLEQDPELLQINFLEDADSGRALGGIVLRYDCEYRIQKGSPETVIP